MRFIRMATLPVAVIMVLSCESRTAPLKLLSPDRMVELIFDMDTDDSPLYSIEYKDQEILAPSHLSLVLRDGELGSEMRIERTTRRRHNETYELVAGKSKRVRNQYNEMRVELQEIKPPQRSMHLVFRVFNDGIAFRYLLPEQPGGDQFEILSELSEFAFTDDHPCWVLYLEDFTTNYERPFLNRNLSDIQAQDLVGLPLMIEIADGPYLTLAEANLTDYAGMYLTGAEEDPTTITRYYPQIQVIQAFV